MAVVFAQLTFAGLAVLDGPAAVAEEALPAVVTVPAGRVVPAVEADATALPARQLVQLHVEPTPPRVQVTVARCRRDNMAPVRDKEVIQFMLRVNKTKTILF